VEICGGQNHKAAQHKIMEQGGIGEIPELYRPVRTINGNHLPRFGAQAVHPLFGAYFCNRQRESVEKLLRIIISATTELPKCPARGAA
jgi:hypothetical protein